MNALILLTALALTAAPQGMRFVADSVAIPDGVSVVCPESRSVLVTETVTGAGYRQLARPAVLFGTVKLMCGDPAWACTDTEHLAGHAQWCLNGVPNEPWIRHDVGQVRLPDPGRVWTVTYRAANGPGRYLRNWGPCDPVTPSMCGGSVQWSATMAGRLNRPLKGEGELWSSVVELPDVPVSGRFKLDAKAALRKLVADTAAGWETPLDRALVLGLPCFTNASGVDRLRFHDLVLEGDYAAVDWAAIAALPNAAAISQRLRESPYGAGISTVAQSGRIPAKRVELNNVYVSGFPSSCVVSDPNTEWTGEHIRIGPTVSGRQLYAEGPADLIDVEINDFSRTSSHRGNAPSRIKGLRYRSSGLKNPWPLNDEPAVVASVSNNRRDGWCDWSGIDIDCTGSDFPAALTIGASGVFRGQTRGGMIGFHPNGKGALLGVWDLDIIDGSPPALSWVQGNATGNWAMLDASLRLTRVDKRPVIDWSVYANGEKTGWSQLIDSPIVLRVKRNASHPANHEQRIRIRMTSDWPTQGLLWLPDLATTPPQDCVPTTIWLEGGTYDNQFCQLISINEGYTQQTWPANISDYPIRIIATGAKLNVWQPGTPYRGDDRYAAQFSILTLRDCVTFGGVPIDAAKVIDGSFEGWAK